MGFYFLSSAAKTEWLAATSQQAQLEALAAAFPGNVTLRYYSAGGTHLDTVTHSPWAINTGTTPRQAAVGGLVARTAVAPDTATYVIAATAPSGGTDILRADIAPMTIVTGSRPNLQPQTGGAGLVVRATSTLPVSAEPTWLAAQPALHTWIEIAGTSAPAGVNVNGYCGWAFRSDNSTAYAAALGGHSNGAQNPVAAISFAANAPAWTEIEPASAIGDLVDGQPHYADGKPNARHTYNYAHWAPTQGRVMLLGCYAPATGSTPFNNVDGYSPSLSSWAAANTFDPCQGGHYGNARMGNGDVWALWSGSSRLWTESTATWSNPTVTYADFVRFPWAWDSTRSQLFGLAWGDSQGSSTGVPGTIAVRAVRHNGTTQTNITLNSIGGALAQFEADAGAYPGMDYDPENDRFLWYDGRGARAGRVYAIAPNNTTNWDISILSISGTPPGATNAEGILSKFSYVPALKCFVLQPQASSNIFAFRVA